MIKKIMIACVFIFFCFFGMSNGYCAATATTGAGDWNNSGNWSSGVPTVNDDAVVSHNMTVDGTGALFATLDNNATITLTANQIWSVEDGGSIDNAGGEIDCDDNDINWTITASVGTTNWTWRLDSGAWDVGSGETHFEYASLTVGTTYTNHPSQGHTFFDENCSITSDGANDYWYMYDMTVAAGVTLTIGDGTNAFYIGNIHDITLQGTSGSHITINGNSDSGYVRAEGNNSGTITLEYIDSENCAIGLMLRNIDIVAGDSFSASNITLTSPGGEGLYFTGNKGTFTLSSVVVSGAGDNGVYMINGGSPNTVNLNDVDSYNCTGSGFEINTANTLVNLTRAESYGNAALGYNSTVASDTHFVLTNFLARENSQDQIVCRDTTGGSMINCTIADTNSSYAGVVVDLDTASNTFVIKNCIITEGKYGVNSTGTSEDPTVTYSNIYGASTSNYTGMTDPTGSNGNISSDPSYVDAAGDDYSIDTDSPCIGAGTSTGAPADDIDANTRPFPAGTDPDMGAYEEQTIAGTSAQVILIAA